MKARIRLELPPGVEITPDVRAKLLKAVEHKLDACGDGCAHDDPLEKSGTVRQLPHVAAQAAVDRSIALYDAMMGGMMKEIFSVLGPDEEPPAT